MTNPKSFVEEKVEEFRNNFPDKKTGIEARTYMEMVEQFQTSLTQALVRGLKLAKEVVPEPKSVDELKEIMGPQYNEFVVEVSFKEGFNKNSRLSHSAIDKEINKLENHER